MKKLGLSFLSFVLGLFAVPMVAMAEIPAAVSTGITALQTDALAMLDLVWPVIIAVVGVLIVMKYFKKAANKI